MSDDEHPPSSPSGLENDPAGLEVLLEYLHRTRGFDFGGYKRSTLSRRIQRRMQLVAIDTYAEYVDFLEVHPDEFQQLFNMILINVTGFYRDPHAWEALATHLPKIIASRPSDRPLRIWSAGCASGEETYTLAMLLAEALGPEQFARRVKIYATDVDEEALAHARQGTYSPKAVEGVPAELLEKYFTRTGSGWVFHKDLRRAVIFGRHDLVQDAPISRVDVLACRNTLMYFNAETQTKILSRLNFALNEDGILFLGKAEMLLTHANLFTPIDLKLRIFARAPRSARGRERIIVDNGNGTGNGNGDGDRKTPLYQASFDANASAQLVIDPGGRTTLINTRALELFGLSAYDVNRPFQDLELSYRPAELRSCLDQARLEKRTIAIKEIERQLPNGEKMYLDISVVPLIGENGSVLGCQVSFADVTQYHRLQEELRRANVDLEAAHEELQSTSEELETTNEELQSTVEELETTNEELQSTNEELETMNEELQSTNEELQTMNEELRQRGEELNQVNGFFGSILASLHAGVAVLDGDLLVKAWNHKMEDLWGLRSDEVSGKHVLNLDIGLPLDSLSSAMRAGVAGETSEKTIECTNRRGKKVRCRVSTSPLRGENNRGVILFVEEVPSV